MDSNRPNSFKGCHSRIFIVKYKAMIKAIIFDIGGVLVNKSPVLDEILEEFDLVKEEIYDYYLKILREHEIGKIDENKFWELLQTEYNITKPIPNPSPLIRRYQKEIKIDKEVLNITKVLRENGYKLAALSNTIPAHVNHLKTLGVFEHFDVVVLSNETHLLKPYPEIYKLTLERLKTKPEETIFIDDVEDYVKGATELGIRGIRFTNAIQLKYSLGRLV